MKINLIILIILSILAASCGKKGKLYLPKSEAETSAQTNQDATK